MDDLISKFSVDKYIHLKEFLNIDNCNQLTHELRRLVSDKKTHRDEQCPMSEAIHGAPVFDSLLVQLLPHFENACGKRLLPTYSYARLYAPGDELKNHTDRESCEISATITLGFDGDIWPIYMGDDINKTNASEIRMQVGDAVLYRGMEKHHWREKYTQGKWQAQVFLHYVDADGPHKEWKYDKRESLNLPKNTDVIRYWSYGDIFTHEACDIIVRSYTKQGIETLPPVIGEGDGSIDRKIRDVERIILPTYKDIGGRLAAAGFDANRQTWQFDVTHANQAEFLKYPTGGHYVTHMDTFLNPKVECRKLTILAFLNDDFEGGRFYLGDEHDRYYPPQSKGTVLVFPSFIMHGVEDVTSGTRYSAVCWLVGPFLQMIEYMDEVSQKFGDIDSDPIFVLKIPKSLLEKIQLFVDNTFNKEDLDLEQGTCTRLGKQTKNLTHSLEISGILDDIHKIISDLTDDNIKPFQIHHVHAIDYSFNGLQTPHKHDHVEDFSFVINLDNSNAQTMFLIDEDYKSFVSEEGKMLLFDAGILHWATTTETRRRVLVGGCRIMEE